MRRRPPPLVLVAVAALCLLLLPLGTFPAPGISASGSTGTAAGDDRRGPALTTPRHRLREATRCQPRRELRRARRVVLLVPGTGSTPYESFGWSYQRALRADGFATCVVRLPDHGLGSFTRAAEYVVVGVRKAARLAGARVSVVGHSQGGALPVWATKFWPDVSRRVRDVVSLAGPFTGTDLAGELCVTGRCAPLAWQLRRNARTVAAMRHAPLPSGRGAPSYTSISTLYDEIVRPQPAASRLRGAVNVVLQDVCAVDPSEHGILLGDPVAYALTLDALTHRGPARAGRLPASTCQQAFIPHGDPAGSPAFLRSVARFALGLTDPRRAVGREPRLPAYARRFAD